MSPWCDCRLIGHGLRCRRVDFEPFQLFVRQFRQPGVVVKPGKIALVAMLQIFRPPRGDRQTRLTATRAPATARNERRTATRRRIASGADLPASRRGQPIRNSNSKINSDGPKCAAAHAPFQAPRSPRCASWPPAIRRRHSRSWFAEKCSWGISAKRFAPLRGSGHPSN